MKDVCGIYTITNLLDGKMYLGYASNMTIRWRVHRSDLRLNIHDNRHLQNAYNKYGETNFLFEVLIECEEIYLASEEHYWATILNVHDDKFGYNIKPTSPIGKPNHSVQTKDKIREITNTNILSGKHHLPNNSGIKNGRRKLTPEQVEQIRRRGTKDTVNMMSEYQVGRKTIYNVIHGKTWKEDLSDL